jgi:EAL domain-containing protein (putative c-di-GMP-specific phosphodiesterase class I)
VIRQAVGLAARGEATEFNLSAASIGDPSVVRELASAIEDTCADASLLVVEVTETAMMNQLDAGRQFAERVTALGCRLALDDFATGCASLSYLKQIPAQLLKIDIEFVRDLTRSETDERLVRGIIGIAREFRPDHHRGRHRGRSNPRAPTRARSPSRPGTRPGHDARTL